MKTILRIAVAAVLMAFAGAASAAEPSPAMKSVVEAAKKEGKLDLSWGGGLMGGDAGLAELIKLMNATYGTAITVRFTPGGSFPQMGAAVVTTFTAKQDSPTDVYLGTNQHIATFSRSKVFAPVDWLALLPGRVDAAMVEADGTAVRINTVIPGGIVYNAKLAPSAPTRLTDLLKPEWKGKIASQPYAATFDLLSAEGEWGEKGLQFARDLSAQLGGLIRCNELERIASGEFLAMAMDCTGRDWLSAQRKGAPIAFVVPADFAAVRYYYLSVPLNAAHPNAAKLFIATLLSPEGQRILFRTADVDLHTFPESSMRNVIAEFEAKGIKFREFTVGWWNAHPETDERTREAVKIISRK
jgi:ABC-type Fe3+ transport system substrate-binding protein